MPSNADIYISNDNLLTYASLTDTYKFTVTFANRTQKIFGNIGSNATFVSGWVESEKQAVFLFRDDGNSEFTVFRVSADGNSKSISVDYDTGGNNVETVDKIAFTRGGDNNYYIFFVYTDADTNSEQYLDYWLIFDDFNSSGTKPDKPFSGDALVAIPSANGAVALTEGEAYFSSTEFGLKKSPFTDEQRNTAITPLAAYVLGGDSYVVGSVEKGSTFANVYRLSMPLVDNDIDISPLYSLGSYNNTPLPTNIAATTSQVFTFSKTGLLIVLPSEKTFDYDQQRIVVDSDELFLTEDERKVVQSVRLQLPGRGNFVKITEAGYLYRSTTA